MTLCRSLRTCGLFRGNFLRMTRAEALLAAGHPDAAQAVAEAEQRLRVHAEKIEDPAYREGFLRDVPENRRILELAGTAA